MAEDAQRTEPSSVSGSTHTIPSVTQEIQETQEVLIPSFTPSSAPSSPTPTSTLSRLGLKSPTVPAGAVAPGSPVDRGQVSAITVVALLDKLVNMLESVQDNQQRMEQRQADLEGAVRVVQGDVTRLSKTHVCTSNSVSKLLERSRKVSGHLKEVRERMDKQAVQVKKLEANHTHLLKRNHFKVLIFQEDNEIPASVLVKDSLKTPQPSQYDAESTRPAPSVTGSVDGSPGPEEGLQTISLSSEEAEDYYAKHSEMLPDDDASCGGPSYSYERRSDKFKRSSLKKVDSIKKAFSRQNIEKKVNQITTKIVPPEKREKIKKSLTPNHPKSPTAKSSSFKVNPMTFNVKKVRDGEVPTQDMGSVAGGAHDGGVHVEIPPLGSLDGENALAEVQTHDEVVVIQEMVGLSSPESPTAEVSFNGEAEIVQCQINGDRSAGLAIPENDDDVGEDEEEGEEEEKEEQQSPVEAAAEAQIPTATIAVEQVS